MIKIAIFDIDKSMIDNERSTYEGCIIEFHKLTRIIIDTIYYTYQDNYEKYL